MPRVVPVVMFLALYPAVANAQTSARVLSVDRPTISAGDSVRLRWSVPGARTVFLSSVGLVEASGELTLRPSQATTYVLSAAGPWGLETAEVHVAVLNARGLDAFPDPEEYGFPFTYEGDVLPIPVFLDRVHDVLQNELRHSVRAYADPDGAIAVETMTRVRSDLLEEDDRVARRRISYRVRVPPADAGPYRFRIETVLEYQLRAERVWRPDNDAGRRERHSRALAQRLSAAVPPPRPSPGEGGLP